MSSTGRRSPDGSFMAVYLGGLCIFIYLIELFLFPLFDVHSATLGPSANCSFRPTPLDFNIVSACASWSDLAVIMGLSFFALYVVMCAIWRCVQGCRDRGKGEDGIRDGGIELGNRRGGNGGGDVERVDSVMSPPPVYSAGAR